MSIISGDISRLNWRVVAFLLPVLVAASLALPVPAMAGDGSGVQLEEDPTPNDGSQDGSCFITTAASGTGDAPNIDTDGDCLPEGATAVIDRSELSSDLRALLDNTGAPLDERLESFDRGVAMAMALGGGVTGNFDNFGVGMNAAYYEGEIAIAGQFVGQLDEYVSISGGFATDTKGQVGVRGGFSWGW